LILKRCDLSVLVVVIVSDIQAIIVITWVIQVVSKSLIFFFLLPL